MTRTGVTVTLNRKELIAKLAAIGNRWMKTDPTPVTVQRISQYVTECGTEFHLTNEEQVLFLKHVVSGAKSAEELMRERE